MCEMIKNCSFSSYEGYWYERRKGKRRMMELEGRMRKEEG